jgi:uncharacterized FlaG/YvyC family protein
MDGEKTLTILIITFLFEIKRMKAATLNELKHELSHLPTEELLDLCTRLARFKKENKELLTFLLFEAHDERSYIVSVKESVASEMDEIPKDNNLYLIKKSLRKVLRNATKYIRYSGSKVVEVEVLLFFCEQLKDSGIAIHKSQAIVNLYEMQLKKINKTIALLHEDLQYDYHRQMEAFV